jgi:hypothetical protein
MALNITEFFGFSPLDKSAEAIKFRNSKNCPFVEGKCIKTFSDGEISGACTVKQTQGMPVICCPQRLYAENYKILQDVALSAFNDSLPLVPSGDAIVRSQEEKVIAVFGKGWGRELRLPSRGGSYFVDWILAVVEKRKLKEFVAIEVQTIDTTGNYRKERDAYITGVDFNGSSKAGLNWENVSKRILPQIIYKGHVLRRESLCSKGMYFICPQPVYERILERLGGKLLDYIPHPGSLTFVRYDIGSEVEAGKIRNLVLCGQQTTTVDQVANAFTNPSNLPPANVYADAITKALDKQ